MSEIRVLPLPKVDAKYGPMGGKYPETVRIAMSDGKVITYRIDIEQPNPSFTAAMENLDRFVVGYKAKHEKKNDRALVAQHPGRG